MIWAHSLALLFWDKQFAGKGWYVVGSRRGAVGCGCHFYQESDVTFLAALFGDEKLSQLSLQDF